MATRCTSSSALLRPPTTSTRSGSADVGFDVFYDLPNQGREALITVSFTFDYEDDEDNTYTFSDTYKVKVAP